MNNTSKIYKASEILDILSNIVKAGISREASYLDENLQLRNSFYEGRVLVKFYLKDGSSILSEISENTNFSNRKAIFQKMNSSFVTQIDWSNSASLKDLTGKNRNAFQEHSLLILRLLFDDGTVVISELTNS